MTSETIRCFIAIALPDNVINEIEEIENHLKSKSPDAVKWVEPKSIHLTLEFLGYTTGEKIPEIIDGLTEAVANIAPFRLSITGLGAFPNLNRVQVIWVGVNGEISPLKMLQKNIADNMEILDFPREEREFSPHLTLGRVRNGIRPEERRKIGEMLAAIIFKSDTEFVVDKVSLFKSQLTPRGAVYSVINTAQLRSQTQTT